MGKREHRSNPRTQQVWDDLEKFLEFCRDHGYRFNEGDLYNFRAYAWQQYHKFTLGKNAKNMWEEDIRRAAEHRR